MTPLELLQAELDKWVHSLEKLEDAFKNDLIPKNVYHERRDNLLPKISSYKRTIAIILSCECYK